MISADTPSRKRELSRILCLSMMLLLAIALLATGLYLWGNTLRATLALPRIQFDNEEAALLYQSQRLHSGETIYRTPQAMMAAPNVYPPVYFLLTAPFTSPDATSLAPGRVLSAISFILILFLVFTATLGKPFRRMTRFDFAAGLVAAGLITLTYEALRWSFFYRVDMLAIALSLAGLIILTTSRQRPGTTRIVCSLILLTAGFYTKQTMLAAPLTACIFLLLRDRRTGIRFACAFGALCLTLFCVLYVLTDGNYLRLTISANVNKFVFHDVIIWLKHLWFFYHYWLIAAGLLFIMAIINRRHLFHNPWPVYLIATLPGLVAIGKLGSAENYLIEPLIALAICTAVALKTLYRRQTQWLLIVPLALLLLYAATQSMRLGKRIAPLALPSEHGLAEWNDLAARIRYESNHGNITWCEPALLNLQSGQPIYYQPFIMSELTRQKQYDSNDFINAISKQKFSLLVTLCDINKAPDSTTYLDETIQAIARNYTFEYSIGYPETMLGPLKTLYVYRANRR